MVYKFDVLGAFVCFVANVLSEGGRGYAQVVYTWEGLFPFGCACRG